MHPTETWEWLDNELFTRFGGGTMAPGMYQGFYRDPETNERVDDESYRFVVAVLENELERLRSLLQAACVIFAQKCIYLSIGGRVEFINAIHYGPN